MCESLFHDRSSLLSTPSHHTTAHSATCSSASLLNQKYLSQDSRYPTDVQIATRKEEWREGDRSLAHYPPPKKKKKHFLLDLAASSPHLSSSHGIQTKRGPEAGLSG